MRTVSVVIVTWNVEDVITPCLHSLHADAGDIDLDVVIVDNGSTDATVERIRAGFPGVRVFVNRSNAGFPVANNQALRIARGELVLFLNPDTEVGRGTLQACLDVLDRDPGAGMVGCRLVLEDGTTQFECARRDYRLRHLLLESLYLHMLFPRSRVCGDHLMSYWDHEGEREVEAISGAFMLVRREAVDRVGGLPAELFMYHEDLAFCLRVRRAGWRIRYTSAATVLHRWRGSSRRSSEALALLEGETKVRLVHEAEGRAAAAVARGVFAVRCVLRLGIAGAGALLPQRRALAERYPRVFDWRTHWLQLVWAVWPRAVVHRMPRADVRALAPAGGAGNG